MAIEMAPKAPPAKAPSSGSGADSASKSGAAGQSGAKGGQSFLSILGSVDTSEITPADTSSLDVNALSSGLSFEDLHDGEQSAVVDLSQSGLVGPDPAALLAQLQMAPPQPLATSAENVPVPGVVKQMSPRAGESFVGIGIAMDNGVAKPAAASMKSGKAALDMAAGAANAAVSAEAGDSKSATGLQNSEGKFALPESVVKAVREIAATVSKTPELSTVALAGNRDKVQDAQVSHKVPANDIVAAVPVGTGGAMGVDGVVGNTASSGVDGQFAEQVSYWLGGDVQKAELTLDGFGADPVEVSISMQGNEAHVMFRTDEPQTRDALANASLELKASLDRQGVLLSGVSVGTSNTGGQSQQQPGGKSSGWRSTKVEAAPAELKLNARPGAVASNRSVDLFV